MPRYGKKSHETVERAMHKRKRGQLKSGPGGKGGTVKSRKQAIAIGLSEAREKGAKVPSASSSKRHSSSRRKTTTRRTSSHGRSATASRSRRS